MVNSINRMVVTEKRGSYDSMILSEKSSVFNIWPRFCSEGFRNRVTMQFCTEAVGFISALRSDKYSVFDLRPRFWVKPRMTMLFSREINYLLKSNFKYS